MVLTTVLADLAPSGGVTRFLKQFSDWAAAQPDVQAAALVGSYARGSASASSDVDLVILAEDPERFLTGRTWVETFGTPTTVHREEYGAMTSIRVHYDDGPEVEFGFTTVQWAQVPPDPGTQDVISGGMRILFERGAILTECRTAIERHGPERAQAAVEYPMRDRWRQLPRTAERDTYFRVLREAVTEFYLANPQNPYQQSGRSSGADRWEQTRRPFVQAIHRSGDFMDIGCANGLLLESLISWAGQEGFALRPHGLDFVPALVELARQRFPHDRGNFQVANAFDWSPLRQYDFVRTNLEYVPEPDWVPFVRRQYAAVAPGGRLILSHYRNPEEPVVDLREVIEQAGLTVAGQVEIPGTAIVWVDAVTTTG